MAKLTTSTKVYTLESPTIGKTDQETCFIFDYYVMIDQEKDSGLTLEIFTYSETLSTIWYSGGMNADLWQQAIVTIPLQNESFKVK